MILNKLPVARLVVPVETLEERAPQLAEHVQSEPGESPRLFLHLFEGLFFRQGLKSMGEVTMSPKNPPKVPG